MYTRRITSDLTAIPDRFVRDSVEPAHFKLNKASVLSPMSSAFNGHNDGSAALETLVWFRLQSVVQSGRKRCSSRVSASFDIDRDLSVRRDGGTDGLTVGDNICCVAS